MRPGPPAMIQDDEVVTARFLYGVCQEVHLVEAALLVDDLGQSDRGAVTSPCRRGVHRAEGVAEEVVENLSLDSVLVGRNVPQTLCVGGFNRFLDRSPVGGTRC